jgi:hypothetical protein
MSSKSKGWKQEGMGHEHAKEILTGDGPNADKPKGNSKKLKNCWKRRERKLIGLG